MCGFLCWYLEMKWRVGRRGRGCLCEARGIEGGKFCASDWVEGGWWQVL